MNIDIKSTKPPKDLKFRQITKNDRDSILDLIISRDSFENLLILQKNIEMELEQVGSDPNYQLYVAVLQGEVLGYCRFYHSSVLPVSKKLYPAPEGWYGMGIVVSNKMRRHGIARFLSDHRLKVLKERGIKEIYSIVDSNNLASLSMHRQFGFQEIAQAEGFLHIKLESGSGSLFKKLIT